MSKGTEVEALESRFEEVKAITDTERKREELDGLCDEVVESLVGGFTQVALRAYVDNSRRAGEYSSLLLSPNFEHLETSANGNSGVLVLVDRIMRERYPSVQKKSDVIGLEGSDGTYFMGGSL